MVTATSLDIEQPQALIAYLREAGHIGPDERLDINPLLGGVSNRGGLVKRPSGEAWVLKQALPKLRVAVDWFSSPERDHREALGLRWLGELAPPGSLPGFVFEDFEHHILAMQAVPEPHANWKQLLLAGQLDPDHVWQFGRLLGAIHHRAFECLDEIRADFEDRSFFESLRLEPYYAYTASQVPASADFYRALMVETRATRLTLVHGDNGAGFPPDVAARVPEPFFTTRNVGLGLGLVVSSKVAESHQGRLENVPAAGESPGVVRLVLPLAPATPEDA